MNATTARVLDVRRFGIGLVAVLLLLPSLGATPKASGAERFVSVIVQAVSPQHAGVAVHDVGGEVTTPLPIVDGVSARVPTASLSELRARPGVVQVTRNRKVSFEAKSGGTVNKNAWVSPPKVLRSDSLWKSKITGKGISVALIDTGVYAHADLSGRVVCGADLSHESGTAANCADTFGHGTFMAGLIAGNGASSSGTYKGTAPDARIISVKAAGYDGSTDVSTILAGIQWVVSHKDTYGIRALNLSLGSDSAQDYRLAPLNYAVQRAWKAGIVVVVSSGNDGPNASTVMKPADDPYVITAGASNSEGTAGVTDDRVPVFSGRGPTRSNGLAKPDLVSPGVHTISLRSPGSAIDNNYGGTARVGTAYFKGTGTSMSAALVSGVVAQVLQKTPSLNPNQVKARLMGTAKPIVDKDPNLVGRGIVDAYAAATSTSLAEANQGLDSSTGLGTLQDSRAGLSTELYANTPLGDAALTGEFTLQHEALLADPLANPLGLIPWDGVTYTTTGWDPVTWDASRWNTADWAGSRWNGATFEATTWDGSRWNGSRWNNEDWDASRWNGLDWDASRWNASRWNSKWYAAAWD
ncbi:MAG TPA: S8 family peptidase [Actinomycetota bacterium]|nr:S8 family peptidase [Actinomycetota bacterium]